MSEPAGLLLLRLHGDMLRLACSSAGVHFQGLASAASFLLKHQYIDNRMKQKLSQLDTTAAFIRHISAPLCKNLYDDLVAQLAAAASASTNFRGQVGELVSPAPTMQDVQTQLELLQSRFTATQQLLDCQQASFELLQSRVTSSQQVLDCQQASFAAVTAAFDNMFADPPLLQCRAATATSPSASTRFSPSSTSSSASTSSTCPAKAVAPALCPQLQLAGMAEKPHPVLPGLASSSCSSSSAATQRRVSFSDTLCELVEFDVAALGRSSASSAPCDSQCPAVASSPSPPDSGSEDDGCYCGDCDFFVVPVRCPLRHSSTARRMREFERRRRPKR